MRLSIRSHLVAGPVMLAALGTSGCISDTTEADTFVPEAFEPRQEGMVSTNQPKTCTASNANLASLPRTSGEFSLAGSSGTEAPAAGVYSNGLDLALSPVSSSSTWLSQHAPDHSCGEHAPAYRSRLDAALASGQAHMVVDPNDVTGAFDFLQDALAMLGVGMKTDYDEKATKFQGYSPERGRWLRQQYEGGKGFLGKEKKSTYTDPVDLENLRMQGARQYCSFKEALRRQNGKTHSMGEMPAISVSILGAQVDFLVVNPTVALGSPEKHQHPGADGAGAFMVPMVFGNTVTPVRGVGLPGLREIRTPMALVSGDSEVVQSADRDHITTGFKWIFGRLVPVGYEGYRKKYHTVLHSDAMMSKGQHAQAAASFPLMYIGPVEVTTGFEIEIDAGEAKTVEDRVLATSQPFGSFPGPTRTGWFDTVGGAGFHDGMWRAYSGGCIRFCLAGFQIEPEGAADWFWRMPFDELGSMKTRGYQDNDHHVDTMTSMGLHLELAGSLGKSFGPVDVNLSVRGGVTGEVTQHHEVRDALFGQTPHPGKNRVLAASGVTVRPRTTANAKLDPIKVKLRFHLDLTFTSIDWEATLLKVPGTQLADYDSDDNRAWGEEAAMRVGTGSEAGDSMKRPDVLSHLPGHSTYPSFPEGVDQCLAAPAPTEPIPDACEPEPATGQPPRAEMCSYAVLSAPQAFTHLERSRCAADMLRM